MADGVFNIAKGKLKYYTELPGTNDALIVVLLTAADGATTLVDYDDLSTLLAAAGNTEAVFTNYVRKTAASVSSTVDDTNDRWDGDFADITWTAAGGATNETLVKALVCYDPDTTIGDDTTIIPLTHHDFAVTTDGTDLTLQVATAGYARAA